MNGTGSRRDEKVNKYEKILERVFFFVEKSGMIDHKI